MPSITRRNSVKLPALTLGAVAVSTGLAGCSSSDDNGNDNNDRAVSFTHGVASGNPLQDAVIMALENYRSRYTLYRTDADLRALHATAPFISVWAELGGKEADQIPCIANLLPSVTPLALSRPVFSPQGYPNLTQMTHLASAVHHSLLISICLKVALGSASTRQGDVSICIWAIPGSGSTISTGR